MATVNTNFKIKNGLDAIGTVSGLDLVSTASSGNEGGEIRLATAATGSTLTPGTITIDIYQNKLRFFETGGTNRGAYIDLTSASTGVGSNLLSGGGASGTTTGSLTFGSLGLAATSGSSPWNGSSSATIDIDTTKVPLLGNSSNTFTGSLTASSLAITGGTGLNVLKDNGTTVAISSLGGGSSITYSSTAPSSPTAGQMWVDSNTGIEYTYVTDANSSQWVELGPSTNAVQGPTGPQGPTGGVAYTYSSSAPISPNAGDIWMNLTSGIEYTYFYDGSSYQWVELRSPGVIGATGPQGPQGPTGATGATGSSQLPITWSKPGTLTTSTGVSRYLFPYSATIIGVSAAVNSAPIGADIIIDVKKNGTTIFTTQANRPKILAGANATAAEVTNMNVTSISTGDYVTIDINQVGSTNPGSDLTVFVRYQQ